MLNVSHVTVDKIKVTYKNTSLSYWGEERVVKSFKLYNMSPETKRIMKIIYLIFGFGDKVLSNGNKLGICCQEVKWKTIILMVLY